MIKERIPEISSLSIEDKRVLMNELWEDLRHAGEDSPDPSLVGLLQERWSAFESNPETAMTLEEFRKRLGKS